MSAQERSQATRSSIPRDDACTATAPDARADRALLSTCVAAALESGAVVRAFAAKRTELTWDAKAPGDFVSDADRAAERALRAVIAARHPDAFVLGEELSAADAVEGVERGLVFVADPLDGTTNFLHGYPWYATSVAAVRDGVLVAGAILNVPTGELFTAVAGGGARRSGEAIRVSSITEPARALVGTGFPFKDPAPVDRYLAQLGPIMQSTAGVRRAGAAALDLADVACGRLDAFWELTLAPWDIAAGLLLVREAGGIATALDGSPARVAHTSLAAGNPTMHAWLLERMGEAASAARSP